MRRINLLLVIIVALAFMFSACCKKQVKKQQPIPQPVKKVEQPKPVEKPAPVVKEEPKPQPKEEVSTKPVTPSLPTYHEVKKGECLWKIAEYKEIYNDPFMWPLIYRANKEKIKDPDLIFPKQVFRIPRDYTESQKQDAIHFAKTRGPWSLWDGK
jgi:nucleoid-associated protein YgaU